TDTLQGIRRSCSACGLEVAPDVLSCPRDGTPIASSDPLIDSTVGEYEVKRAVGQGGMGIVYEAIQPLIGKRVAIKVFKPDFARAKHSWRKTPDMSATQDLAITGTPDYMAPEQVRGEDATPQTDLYAIGVVAYQMLTGDVPFRAPSLVEVMTAHLKAVPPRPSLIEPSIPHELEELVIRLMAKAPADRPKNAEEVRVELKRISHSFAQAITKVTRVPDAGDVPAGVSM